MEWNALIKSLIIHIHSGLAFIWWLGQLYRKNLRKSNFAEMDQPGSVVVQKRCFETEISGSILGGYLQISFFLSFSTEKIVDSLKIF